VARPISRRVSRRVSANQAIRPADYRRLAAFRHALRRFLAFSEAAARAAGITPQQHQALLAIKGAASPQDATIGFLADQLLLQPHSAAELAERMVRSGLLLRRESAADRRRVVLALTASAERVLQDLSAEHIRELRLSAPVIDGLFDVLTPPRAGRSDRRKSRAPNKKPPKKK
jgi:DNA-binding MarR family transcriptional regulator